MAGLYGALVDAMEEFLKKTDSTGPKTSKSNKEIVKAIKQKVEQGLLSVKASDGTMLNYLSRAAHDVDSGITSGGPRSGYWYSGAAKTTQRPDESDDRSGEISGEPRSNLLECDLYPLVELWLEENGYTSKDLSHLKSGGPWGNPDIMGGDLVSVFGAVQIELVSCEVKNQEAKWEKDIFEAISHKRFSNRSWFCYRVSNNDAQLPEGMKYYAERYRVGVVQINLSDNELEHLRDGEKAPLDFIDRVVERVPALYDYVPLAAQAEVISRCDFRLSLQL